MHGVEDKFEETNCSIDLKLKTAAEFCPMEHISQKGARQRLMREKIDGLLLTINKTEGL